MGISKQRKGKKKNSGRRRVEYPSYPLSARLEIHGERERDCTYFTIINILPAYFKNTFLIDRAYPVSTSMNLEFKLSTKVMMILINSCFTQNMCWFLIYGIPCY